MLKSYKVENVELKIKELVNTHPTILKDCYEKKR
jgi:hypothetical protein